MTGLSTVSAMSGDFKFFQGWGFVNLEYVKYVPSK